MRRILLLSLPFLLVVSVALSIFTFVQVQLDRERRLEDLRKKAQTVSEGIGLLALDVMREADPVRAQILVNRFADGVRVKAMVLYDAEAKPLAISKDFKGWEKMALTGIERALREKTYHEHFERLQDAYLYGYLLPLVNEEKGLVGALEVIFDAAYIEARSAEFQRRMFVTLAVLLITITAIVAFLERMVFTAPIHRFAEWIKQVRKGETREKLPFAPKRGFERLASEIEQAALSVAIAKRAMAEKAEEKIKKEEIWTETKLKDFVRAKLGESSLVVVSNREPYMHVFEEGILFHQAKCITPASGLVTAVDPAMRATGGIWIAHGAGVADKEFVGAGDKLTVPVDDPRYILRRVWLTKEEEEGYYYGFSNEGLWPLCHITYTRPLFKASDWQAYKDVNRKFADVVLAELTGSRPFVWVHDYHFTLLPKMIKDQRPDAVVSMFWHIPWPNPEIFRICPWQNEILDGMLGADLLGFHLQFHCNNFLETVNRAMEARVDMERFSVIRAGRETFVRAFPISISMPAEEKNVEKQKAQIEKLKKDLGIAGEFIALGIDRIDYTKGIIERLHAVERFLEKYPKYKKKFRYVELGAPSRTHIKRYHDLNNEIDELVDSINWKFAQDGWRPIIFLRKHIPTSELAAFNKMSDACIVSSLHDGMNLVAKEYVAAKDDLSGILVLSRFTGASRELTDAILINPYDIEEFAEAIRYAVEMDPSEKRARMEKMRQQISEANVYKWAGTIIDEMSKIGTRGMESQVS